MTAAIAFRPLPTLSMSTDEAKGATERDHVVAAQKGSDAAFAELVRLHQRRAYAVARAIVLSHEDAEDAVQDGFLHAYRALDRFRSDQPFGAWLNRIVANAALDLVRRRMVRDADELRRRLADALTHLTDRQRAVIVLHDVEGYTHGEIGSMLGIPEGTARSDLHHARAALRRLLKDVRSDT
jgi:RNA polymerase sigma-70 factor (ECF subfamily)